MGHRLRVFDSGAPAEQSTTEVWRNFRRSHEWKSPYDVYLAEYGGKDNKGSEYVEFETEEDLTLFLLKFS